ncbi:CDPK-related kinase 5 [Chionoecetes opilio]|uniref:CDPK-related kinase 5 n=1 Tax=Chionoecetes opilio TaxID=41210 RepID=A0A8J4Y5P0_CHIOP|nr:CDPK-related kinase 5 [Chionoecetes opilio]
MDWVLDKVVDQSDCGASVGNTKITDLAFADDAVIFAESLEVLVMALQALHEEAKPLGLEVSWLKTKVQTELVVGWAVVASGEAVSWRTARHYAAMEQWRAVLQDTASPLVTTAQPATSSVCRVEQWWRTQGTPGDHGWLTTTTLGNTQKLAPILHHRRCNRANALQCASPCVVGGKWRGRGSLEHKKGGRLALSKDEIVRVAVKEPVDEPELIENTCEEAAVLREVEGEAGVPHLYGVTTDSPPCLVMQLCPGDTLEECLGRGEVRACLLALVQVCGVVRRLHARGITHGDIHERNVLTHTSKAGEVRAFLLDFGLAKRGTDPLQQESDVIDVVATALEMIPDADHLTDLRWRLNTTSSLDEVTALLHEALNL